MLTRAEVNIVHRLPDERLALLPLISVHDRPQLSPQEYQCGCIAITRITDRDAQHRPFEMRLAVYCRTDACTLPLARMRPGSSPEHTTAIARATGALVRATDEIDHARRLAMDHVADVGEQERAAHAALDALVEAVHDARRKLSRLR